MLGRVEVRAGRAGPPLLRLSLPPCPGVTCYMPANGETVTLPTSPSIPVGISLGLLKREMAQGMWGQACRAGPGGACWLPTALIPAPFSTGLLPDAKKPRLLHGTLIMKDSVSARGWSVGVGELPHSLTCPCPTELPAGVLRAGPQGAGHGRAPAALHLPRAPARHTQGAGDGPASLQPPEEVGAGPGGRGVSRQGQGLTMPPCSVLKDHCVQHLPDGSVTVESILIQAAAHSEDPGTKVLLVSWTYQVCGGTQAGLRLAVGQDRRAPPITLGHLGGVGRMAPQPLGSCCRTKSWGATSPPCSRRVCRRPPAEAADCQEAALPFAQLEGCGLLL